MIRHASAVKPRIYPHDGDITPVDMDRVQSIRLGVTRPNEAVYEVGRKDELARDWSIPEATVSITQFEYGTLDAFLAFANKTGVDKVELSDFDTSKIDVVTFEKDRFGGDFVKSTWLPKLSLTGLSLNIADAEAKLERTFDFAGDDYLTLREDNKCFIYKKHTAGTGTDDEVDLSDPAPVEDPNNTGKYIFRVLRVRGAVTTELVETTDYTYSNSTKILTILSIVSGDVIKVYYTATTFGGAGNPTALNDSDDAYIKANQISVYLIDGSVTNYVYKLQSLSIASTLERISQAEIGNDEKILRETRSYATTVTLRGFVESASIDEILAGKSGQDWGILDVRKYIDTTTLIVKIYEDATKTTFKMGYKVANLKFPGKTKDVPVNDFLSVDVNLEADNLLITTNEGEL